MARIEAVINIEDNCISGNVCSEIRDSKETPNIEKVNKVGVV
jgi:hypothetical protein